MALTLKYNVGETIMVPMKVVGITAKLGKDTSNEIQFRVEHEGTNAGPNTCVFDSKIFEEKNRKV